MAISAAVGVAVNFQAYLRWAHENRLSVRKKVQVEAEKKKKEEPVRYIMTEEDTADYVPED